MTTTLRTKLPCVTRADVFLHPLMEDASSAATTADRNQQHQLRSVASSLCSTCPMLAQCRYDAVVRFDVAGFVAGTTPSERQDIRRALNHKVAPEDFDAMAGAFSSNRQVNHAEVLRLRTANPHETLEWVADRLKCSLSTVKRHLRKAREASPVQLRAALPSTEQVTYAAAAIAATRSRRRAA